MLDFSPFIRGRRGWLAALDGGVPAAFVAAPRVRNNNRAPNPVDGVEPARQAEWKSA
jgi:hypothetical protein